MNKILYKLKDGKPSFWGIMDIPRYPDKDKIGSWLYYHEAVEKYEADFKKCKANALEIINWEDENKLDVVRSKGERYTKCLTGPLKDGDTFPLPDSLEFKREFKNDCRDVHGDCQLTGDEYRRGCQHRCKKEVEVLRLVPKTKPEDYNNEEYIFRFIKNNPDMLFTEVAEHLKSKFTIKRNKI